MKEVSTTVTCMNVADGRYDYDYLIDLTSVIEFNYGISTTPQLLAVMPGPLYVTLQ